MREHNLIRPRRVRSLHDGAAALQMEWDGETSRTDPAYVRWIQQSLNKALGLRLAADGKMGPQTRSAIRQFQKRKGLAADGIVGSRTEAALKAATGVSAPAKAPSFRYVKGFAGPNAECVAALRRAGKTEAEALTIINTQIGVAVTMLRKAAADLQRGKRSTATRNRFLNIFRVRPEFVPTWLKPTATIKDRGDVVAVRCSRVADLLASGRIRFFCAINSTNCPDCGNDNSDFACSSWGDESTAPARSNVICLGNGFWDDMKAGRTDSLLSTLMHEPFHIYFGKYVTSHRADAGKFGGINCLVQFVFEANGRTTPARVSQRCRDMAVRNELEAALEMEATAVPTSTCLRSFAVEGFGYTRSTLTSSQKSRVASIALNLYTGAGNVPPLSRVKQVRITGFASGTRRLDLHAQRRAKSVSEELVRQLQDLGAVDRDIAKISIDHPITKPVKSQGASDARFRKVEICVVRSARPAGPTPPVKVNLVDMLRRVPITTLGRSPAERLQLQNLRNFLARGLAGERIDDRYWQFSVLDGLGRERNCGWTGGIIGVKRSKRPQQALANFKRNCATARDVEKVGQCLKNIHDAVLCHINALLKWADQTRGDTRLRDSAECAWLLELQAASRRNKPKSIYSCFIALLGDEVGHVCT